MELSLYFPIKKKLSIRIENIFSNPAQVSHEVLVSEAENQPGKQLARFQAAAVLYQLLVTRHPDGEIVGIIGNYTIREQIQKLKAKTRLFFKTVSFVLRKSRAVVSNDNEFTDSSNSSVKFITIGFSQYHFSRQPGVLQGLKFENL